MSDPSRTINWAAGTEACATESSPLRTLLGRGLFSGSVETALGFGIYLIRERTSLCDRDILLEVSGDKRAHDCRGDTGMRKKETEQKGSAGFSFLAQLIEVGAFV